jgi:hypothetical protein
LTKGNNELKKLLTKYSDAVLAAFQKANDELSDLYAEAENASIGPHTPAQQQCARFRNIRIAELQKLTARHFGLLRTAQGR